MRPQDRGEGPPAPPVDCRHCPRLVAYRDRNRAAHPLFHNAPVPSFGPLDARLLIVGLAPGLKGANQTGRPFTGDYAGDLLYQTLQRFDFADGAYGKQRNDGLTLRDCRITNAVRCVPPENKPTTEEIRRCQPFLKGEFEALSRLQIVLALGVIAHGTVLNGMELVKSRYPFAHRARFELGSGLRLIDSYHCSRYNTNTGRLTEAMFEAVFDDIRSVLVL